MRSVSEAPRRPRSAVAQEHSLIAHHEEFVRVSRLRALRCESERERGEQRQAAQCVFQARGGPLASSSRGLRTFTSRRSLRGILCRVRDTARACRGYGRFLTTSSPSVFGKRDGGALLCTPRRAASSRLKS